MGHRAKHLHRNWIPERLAKAWRRKLIENRRQTEAAARKTKQEK
jgi:hypothetical protein